MQGGAQAHVGGFVAESGPIPKPVWLAPHSNLKLLGKSDRKCILYFVLLFLIIFTLDTVVIEGRAWIFLNTCFSMDPLNVSLVTFIYYVCGYLFCSENNTKSRTKPLSSFSLYSRGMDKNPNRCGFFPLVVSVWQNDKPGYWS